MAIPSQKIVALALSVALITGCTSVKIIRNPDEADTGVRFYRPKPYLLVTPADPTGRLVNIKLEYLPDFNEEYSAHLKGKASVALKDGWNLVGVNTKEAPKDKEEPPAKIEAIPLPGAVVSATNVPMGYYESVYGMAGSRKFLQGWRYIGMTILGGGQPNVCTVPGHTPNCPGEGSGTNGCISGPLFGMVFFNGVMTFRQLDEIANNQLCPSFVNPTPAEAPPVGPVPVPGGTEVVPGAEKIKTEKVVPNPTPATPSPETPPASTGLYRPKVTPALVAARPAVTPARIATTAAKPTITPASASTSKPVVTKATASSTAATAPWSLGQDPLSSTPPSLDQDFLPTGSSPRR